MTWFSFLFLLVSYSYSKGCGKENKRVSRISGGNTVKPNQYPFVVMFTYFKKDAETEYLCGGSIISDRLVLTAKHCTEEAVRYGPVRVKVHNAFDSEDYERAEIERAILPNDVDPDDHDIAILVLKMPLDLTDPKLGIVCLPEQENKVYRGKDVKGLGWGMVGKAKKGKFLKFVDLVIDNVKSNKSENWLYTKVNKIKGVYQDPCSGDSGGPLIYKESNRWTVIGTVNGGGYDCRTGSADKTGRWNKVGAHVKWIKDIIANFTEKVPEKNDEQIKDDEVIKEDTKITPSLNNGYVTPHLNNGNSKGHLNNDNMYKHFKNGYNNGDLNNGYSKGDINNGYSNRILNNGYSNGLLNNGYSNGVLNNGMINGVLNNGYRSGVINDGYSNGVLNNGYRNVVLNNGYSKTNLHSGYNKGIYNNKNNFNNVYSGGVYNSLNNGYSNGVYDGLNNGNSNGVLSNGYNFDNGYSNALSNYLKNVYSNVAYNNGYRKGVLNNGYNKGGDTSWIPSTSTGLITKPVIRTVWLDE